MIMIMTMMTMMMTMLIANNDSSSEHKEMLSTGGKNGWMNIVGNSMGCFTQICFFTTSRV